MEGAEEETLVLQLEVHGVIEEHRMPEAVEGQTWNYTVLHIRVA